MMSNVHSGMHMVHTAGRVAAGAAGMIIGGTDLLTNRKHNATIGESLSAASTLRATNATRTTERTTIPAEALTEATAAAARAARPKTAPTYRTPRRRTTHNRIRPLRRRDKRAEKRRIRQRRKPSRAHRQRTTLFRRPRARTSKIRRAKATKLPPQTCKANRRTMWNKPPKNRALRSARSQKARRGSLPCPRAYSKT